MAVRWVLAAGIGAVTVASAAAQLPALGGVPKLDNRYIKQHPCPTIAPGSCFGHFPTKWTRWNDACPNWGGGAEGPSAPATPVVGTEKKPDPQPLQRDEPVERLPFPRAVEPPPAREDVRAAPGLPTIAVPPLPLPLPPNGG